MMISTTISFVSHDQSLLTNSLLAVKYSVELNLVNWAGDEPDSPVLMSRTMLQALLELQDHSSKPWMPSFAEKYNFELNSVICYGVDSSDPELMSFTMAHSSLASHAHSSYP